MQVATLDFLPKKTKKALDFGNIARLLSFKAKFDYMIVFKYLETTDIN